MQLHVLASGSEYVLPSFGQSKYNSISPNSLNQVAEHTVELAQRNGLPIEKFVLHDMRRTASTHWHETGYHSDWIEKALSHEQYSVRAVYNKAEYAEQRRTLLRDWADMAEWIEEYKE